MCLVPSQINESPDIEYSLPVFEEFMETPCAYNYTEQMEETDVIDAYLTLPWSYYVSVFTTFIIFIMIWKLCTVVLCKVSDLIKSEIANARLPSSWIMTCAILDQDQYPKISSITFTILSFCFTLFFYITIDCFILNTMSTDLVVIKEPTVARSYEDISARDDLILIFHDAMDEKNFFRNAEEGTIEAKLWKKVQIFNKTDAQEISKVWFPIQAQKMVGIARDWMCHVAASLGIKTTREMGVDYIRAIFTKDQTGKSFLNAFMIRKDAPARIKEFMTKR